MGNLTNEQLEKRIEYLEQELDKKCPIEGFSYGAMMLNIFWAFGNKSYLPLIAFIPPLNIFWILICGLHGYEWAWYSARKKGIYETKEQFIAVQKSWDRAGKILFYIIVGVLAFCFLVAIFFELIYG